MNQPKQERFKTSVGGQALMEGIMMRGPKNICCAVRKPDGTIETKIEPTPTHGIWTKIPLVRGAISMVESLIMGYRYMMYSAQVSMGDDYDPEEEETAFEKWVGDHLGKKAEDVLLGVAAVLGGLFAILLFTVLPTVLVGGVNRLLPLGRWSKVVLEAVLKVAIFLSYMVERVEHTFCIGFIAERADLDTVEFFGIIVFHWILHPVRNVHARTCCRTWRQGGILCIPLICAVKGFWFRHILYIIRDFIKIDVLCVKCL